ncbi:MAG: sulfatase-like hydrolase/transferase, partial [Methylohalobius sp.]|nr:sulfatase-like hydrolase/transferase [Methylohalobius sp.]
SDVYKRQYQGASLFAMARLTEPFEIIRSQREPREAFDLDQIIALYDGCVRCFDDEVRKIFHHLKRCGLDRNTVVAILSDHGMELFEHGTWGQGNSAVGEQSNRIPVLIVAPQYAGQGQVDAIIRAQDIAPTLLDCLGIAPSSSMTGVSLRSFLAGEQSLRDLAATFCTGLWLTRPPGMAANHLCYPDLSELLFIPDPQSGTLVIKPEFREQIERARDVAICWRHWKLVRLALNPRPRYLLFNLAEDPSCHEDVADRFPEIAGTLRSWLEQSSKFD